MVFPKIMKNSEDNGNRTTSFTKPFKKVNWLGVLKLILISLIFEKLKDSYDKIIEFLIGPPNGPILAGIIGPRLNRFGSKPNRVGQKIGSGRVQASRIGPNQVGPIFFIFLTKSAFPKFFLF